MRSDDAGDSWHEVSGNLPSDFGFAIDVHRPRAGHGLRRPDQERRRTLPAEGKLRVYRTRCGGNEWEPLTAGLPQQDCYVNVLRDAMCVDALDPCGVYFGHHRRAGVSPRPTAATNWTAIVRDLPAVLSVEVQVVP